MTLEEMTLVAFEHIHKRVLGTDIKRSKKLINGIAAFIKRMSFRYGLGDVGPNFIVDYLFFQFEYLDFAGRKSVSVDDMFGTKASNAYQKRKSNYQRMVNEKLLQKFNITVDEVKELFGGRELGYMDLDVVEEREKKYFSGQERLNHCYEHTTLYHPKSLTCMSCSMRSKCKEKLLSRSDLIDVAVGRGLLDI